MYKMFQIIKESRNKQEINKSDSVIVIYVILTVILMMIHMIDFVCDE